MFYARYVQEYTARNTLEKAISERLAKYDGLLIFSADLFIEEVKKDVANANRQNKRCLEKFVTTHQHHLTKTINRVAVTNLCYISLYEINGTFDGKPESLNRFVSANAAEPASPAEPAPVPAEPAPAPEASTTSKPAPGDYRQIFEIWEDQYDQKFLKFLCIDEFPTDIQQVLLAGNVWGIYCLVNNEYMVEEFGGMIHRFILP